MGIEWELYGKIRQSLENGYVTEALQEIKDSRMQTEIISGYIACLEAACYEKLDDKKNALSILEKTISDGFTNYWVYHQIASTYRNLGRSDECCTSYQTAHKLQGWEESKNNGYIFTHDFFSANIPSWEKWFSEFITFSPIQILEIGSWQGGSATWCLDKIISLRGGRLTCVDTFEGSSEHANWIKDIGDKIENIFDHNIKSSGHSHLCRKLIGYSQQVLRELYAERFHFIYIDGAHEARYVLEDAILAYGLLSEGGYILFDDYDFQFPFNPRQNTARAVDTFIDIYSDEITVTDKGRQVLIQKKINGVRLD